jgi:hypothetical protein
VLDGKDVVMMERSSPTLRIQQRLRLSSSHVNHLYVLLSRRHARRSLLVTRRQLLEEEGTGGPESSPEWTGGVVRGGAILLDNGWLSIGVCCSQP